MIATKVEIRGLNDVLRTFDEAPKEMRNVVKKAMRAAARKTSRTLKSRTPKRWRNLVGYAVWQNRKTGAIGARLGYYASKNSRRGQNKNPDVGRLYDWYKAYWLNYGTLSGRDPSHTFRKAVKPGHYAAARRRRNRSGIPHRNFFENAISGWDRVYVDEFKLQMDRTQKEAFK